MTEPTSLTPEQSADAVRMIGDLKQLRDSMPSFKYDPDGHYLQWEKIMATSVKLEKLLPPQTEPL